MENKDRILEAALDLFYEKGYDAVGVQEIAERSNVTKPTLYHYFGSKSGLLEAVVETYYTQFENQIKPLVIFDGDLPKCLYRLVKNYFDGILKDCRFYMMFMSMAYAAKDSDAFKIVTPYAKRHLELLTSFFVSAQGLIGNMNGRQEQYAITLIGVMNNYLSMHYRRYPDIPISDEMVFAIVHQFMHGIFV